MISQKELMFELMYLKQLGLTEEEIEGYLEFYKRELYSILYPKLVSQIIIKGDNNEQKILC